MLKIALESLGCSKNLVDAEIMMGILNEKGYKLTGNFEEADVILVNTCGFIESAKQESIQTILEFAELKETANLKLLIVTGCLAQRYADELKEEIPEIDAIVGTGSYQNIDEILAELSEKHQIVSLNNIEFAYDENLPRYVSTPSHMAYLKIGEGCDNKCTYCIIPKLRGKYRSRKMEDIIAEAKKLAERGVKELVVIAQDTTKYGLDLYGEEKLANLLEELAQIEGFKWIRVMYSYPESITEELVKVIKKYDNICNYFDMPIQHASNRVLKLMNRKYDTKYFIEKINKIRKIRPDISITTDVIVGFPNETDKNFNETIETIKKVDFSKLHVFPYSKREGTKAATMEGQVKEEIKKQRVMELLKLSKELENKYMNKFIGKTLTFIPEVYKDGYLIGHTGNYLLIKLKGCEELLHKEVSVKLMENQYPYIISSAI